jgi:hypothetical protein
MKIENFTINNKYTKWYLKIIENAQNRASTKKEAKELLGYVEGHHIIPRSIHKNKDIVYLTPREHFICHLLLTKMVISSDHKQKMYFALASFMRDKEGKRNITNKQFQKSREAVILTMTGRTVAESTRLKQSLIRKGRPALNKGKPGKKTGPCAKSRRENISKGRLNTTKIKCAHCDKETDPGNFAQYHGDNCKYNPNISLIELERRSIKAKQSMQKSKENGTFSKPKIVYGEFTCPHCNKIGINYGVMMRHHFDRCKHRESPDTLLLT